MPLPKDQFSVLASVSTMTTSFGRVGAGKLDLALAWGEPDGPHAGRLAELPLRWIGPAGRARPWPAGEPLPLVAFGPPCRFRAAGVAALDTAGIAWRLVFTSPGLTGLWAAVAAGPGVSRRTAAGLPGGVRVRGTGEGRLPPLPRIALSLHAVEAERAPAVALLAMIPRETLGEKLHAFRDGVQNGAEGSRPGQ